MSWLADARHARRPAPPAPAGRWRAAVAFAGLLAVLPGADAFAAGQTVTFRADDGRTVTATVTEASHEPAPAVVLVPALGHPRDEWQAIAQRFADQGITTLAIDLPSPTLPGDAKELAGWDAVVRSAVTWLASQPTIRSSAIGVAGASLGGTLAALAAANDPRIRGLALISPSVEYRGVRIESALRQVGSRRVLFMAGRKDPYAVRSARDLTKDATGPRETILGEAASHGVPLLIGESDLALRLVDWFQLTLGVN